MGSVCDIIQFEVKNGTDKWSPREPEPRFNTLNRHSNNLMASTCEEAALSVSPSLRKPNGVWASFTMHLGNELSILVHWPLQSASTYFGESHCWPLLSVG